VTPEPTASASPLAAAAPADGPALDVAVVGGGLAGLAAAWWLGARHRVTLFERHDRPGFSAAAVAVPHGGADHAVDVPLRVFYPGYYPTLLALYAELGVATEPVSYASSFCGADGIPYFRWHNLRLGGRSWPVVAPQALLQRRSRRIVRGALRFHRQTRADLARGALAGVTLGQVLQAGGYPEEFVGDLLLPIVATICTCPYEAALAFPAELVAGYLARGLVGGSVRRALHGADDAVQRALARGARLRCGVAVERIVRVPGGASGGAAAAAVAAAGAAGAAGASAASGASGAGAVQLDWAGGSARFDHVVLASPAHLSRRLLADATPEESALLGAIDHCAVEVVTHRDERLMPARRADWAPVNARVEPGAAQPSTTIWINAVQPALRDAAPLFQTVAPAVAPRAGTRVGQARFERPVVTPASLRAIAALPALHAQPGRRVWFCGSWARAGIPLLEAAVASARDAVAALLLAGAVVGAQAAAPVPGPVQPPRPADPAPGLKPPADPAPAPDPAPFVLVVPPAPDLDLLAPRPGSPPQAHRTARETVHVLGRTRPGAVVTVGGEPVEVFATGVFARDRVPLQPGPNRIVLRAQLPEGAVVERVLEVERVAPPPATDWPAGRGWIDGASLRPAEPLRVAAGEPVEVSARATPGWRVQVRLPGQRAWQDLAEAPAGRGGPGLYRALLRFPVAADVEAEPLRYRLLAPPPASASNPALGASGAAAGAAKGRPAAATAAKAVLTAVGPAAVGQWADDPQRLVEVGADGAELLHGLHGVRLGGPFIAELPAGTRLQAVAERGDSLRVRLAPGVEGWLPRDAVAPAPPGSVPPYAVFTSVSVAPAPAGTAGVPGLAGDVVTLPLAEPVPYAVQAVTDARGAQALQVDVFGTHLASTWITHRADRALVREVTAEAAGPQRVRLTLRLGDRAATGSGAGRLWGWRVERTATALRIVVLPGPGPLPAAAASPLAGLHVAVEAGHGGPTNLGAVGATGVPEKDIVRAAAERLRAELLAAGARVTMVREGDDNPPLRERARRVLDSGAQLFVSVHANAADTDGGFLRVAGTSHYYKHANGRDLAEAVHARMLAATGMRDFGLVGNFNYLPLRRVSAMPAVLVETAFVSHPGDEARLLDPAARDAMMRAVRQGLEDFVRGWR
jgi:predicted NAD/FAD-binding protein/N-acetylmuramoyl-L-alanine amidase